MGNSVAFYSSSGALTWRGFFERVQRIAGGLSDRGVHSGDRIAIHDENSVDFLATIVACSGIGSIPVPVNHRLSDREVNAVLDDCKPTLLLGQREGMATVPLNEVYTSTGAPRCDLAADSESIGLLVYTSGSTGAPKGVPLSFSNLWHNHMQFLEILPLTPDDCTLAVAPFFHVAGLNVLTFPAILIGASTLIQSSFDPNEAARALEGQATCAFMVPQMWQKVFERGPRCTKATFGVVGGAPSWPELFESAEDAGIELFEGYGMTEAAPMVTVAGAADRSTVGHPASEVKIMIVEDGLEVPDGHPGEVYVKGPNVMNSYWGRPVAIARHGAGWHQTGDIGLVDPEGRLVLKGRLNDKIISGGENVFPAEVEQVLVQHPEVRNICVLGVPDQRWGEKVVAMIEAPYELGASQLAEFARGRLGRFKLPREVMHIDRLPLTGSGKVDRAEARRIWSHFG